MKAALVFGGTGALGRAAIEEFSGAGFRTVSVDFAASEQASRSVRIPQGHWGDQLKFIESELAQGKWVAGLRHVGMSLVLTVTSRKV